MVDWQQIMKCHLLLLLFKALLGHIAIVKAAIIIVLMKNDQ